MAPTLLFVGKRRILPTSPHSMQSSSIGPLYILHFSSTHQSFRLPDLRSACKYLNIPFSLVPTPTLHPDTSGPDVSRPYMLAHLPNDECAARLLARCVSLRSVWLYWSHGATYAQLHERNKANKTLWNQHVDAEACPSWKAHIFSYSGTISDSRKLNIIQDFSYMGFQGKIKLRDPCMRWGVMKEYLLQEHWPTEFLSDPDPQLGDQDPRLVQIFCGRRIDLIIPPLIGPLSGSSRKSSDPALEGQTGLARDLIDKLNLKKRAYIGNTSMEAEMSLLQANMALAGPGKLCYDPFAGTGSLLYACAAFGATVFGSDIDGRALRGKENKKDPSTPPGIMRSAQQYGLRDRILDVAVFDMTQSPWRVSGILDAIIADPPYGVREGARRLGKRDPAKHRTEPFWMPEGLGEKGCWSHERPDYIPPTRPYHLKDLIADLLDYAYKMLTPGGRLVFWLPDMIDDESQPEAGIQVPVQLPRHTTRKPGTGRMRLVDHSLQDFGRWGRRLITMEKVMPEEDDEEVQELNQRFQRMQNGVFRASADPGEFRNRYFVPRAERYAQ